MVYLTQQKQNICNKQHETKVLVFTAVTHPGFDHEDSNYKFDGKIGMWPFAAWQPAQKASRNCPRRAKVTTLSTLTMRLT
jgi:hypothetical protein